MAEAKRRNPDIVLLGLVYAWPSWVNPSGSNPWQSTRTEQNAADYIARWVSGCKSAHNLTIDWVGLWSKCDDASAPFVFAVSLHDCRTNRSQTSLPTPNRT